MFLLMSILKSDSIQAFYWNLLKVSPRVGFSARKGINKCYQICFSCINFKIQSVFCNVFWRFYFYLFFSNQVRMPSDDSKSEGVDQKPTPQNASVTSTPTSAGGGTASAPKSQSQPLVSLCVRESEQKFPISPF